MGMIRLFSYERQLYQHDEYWLSTCMVVVVVECVDQPSRAQTKNESLDPFGLEVKRYDSNISFSVITLLERADEESNEKAEKLYLQIINSSESQTEEKGETLLKYKEQAILSLLDEYVKNKQPEKIVQLSTILRPFFAQISKAKTAKLVRILLDRVAVIPGTESIQINLCLQTIEWCRLEKRNIFETTRAIQIGCFVFTNRS
eukprot:jgi/Galph1/3218/GphlegSOOS_G1932.1